MTTDEIRKAILEQKQRLKLTYAEIENKSGVSISTIYKYIYGQSGISTELLEFVLNAMGLELKIVPMKDGGRNE